MEALAIAEAPFDQGHLGGEGTDETGPQGLWPSPAYSRQIERLKAAIGETIFLAELNDSAVQLGIRITGTPFILLAVIDFPRPDPTRGLAPHLVVLDDGRGVNLGRIARITRHRAFSPQPADILYQDMTATQHLLFGERRLSRDFIAHRSRAVLGQLLGRIGDLLPNRLTASTEGLSTGEAPLETPLNQAGLDAGQPRTEATTSPGPSWAPADSRPTETNP